MIDKNVITELGQRCITHLNAESEVLGKFVNVSQRIRDSLGSHDDEMIAALKTEQVGIESEAEAMRGSRDKLRQDIATAIGRQVDATSIKSLEDHLPVELGNEIGMVREKIEERIKQIKILNQTNAVLLQHNIDVFQRLILGANGQTSSECKTYSSKGLLQKPTVKVPITVSN